MTLIITERASKLGNGKLLQKSSRDLIAQLDWVEDKDRSVADPQSFATLALREQAIVREFRRNGASNYLPERNQNVNVLDAIRSRITPANFEVMETKQHHTKSCVEDSISHGYLLRSTRSN